MDSGAHTADKKFPNLPEFKKVTMMMGKATPHFLKKPLLSHISFLFVFHSFVTGRQHVFLLLPEVSDLLKCLKVHLIVDFCIFCG